MIYRIKNTLGRNFTNAQGWRTNRKILVIESDDWGSIRMPNNNTSKKFTDLGYNLANNPYCRYDTLASSDDLMMLFDVLRSYRNSHGQFPKFTFNTVVANPRFDKIKNSDFNSYYYEPFTETLNKYFPKENILEVWNQGISEKMFQPQFHGREHVNVLEWLKKLKEGNQPLRDAFELEFWGIPKTLYGQQEVNIQAAFGIMSENHLDFYKGNIIEGLDLFENIFGFRSKTFIANNNIYPEELNPSLIQGGVKGIQCMRWHKLPKTGGTLKLMKVFTGKVNDWQQKYSVRNAIFEPSQMPKSFDNIGNCLKQINNSFFWKKPAIIMSHRLNYIGMLDKENRTRNLKMLGILFENILKRWPDVEFLSSDELIDSIN